MNFLQKFLINIGLACPHKWRPALTSKSPARYCNICEKVEHLTEPEFYAYFGRIPK